MMCDNINIKIKMMHQIMTHIMQLFFFQLFQKIFFYSITNEFRKNLCALCRILTFHRHKLVPIIDLQIKLLLC